jgi:hypothetical protein
MRTRLILAVLTGVIGMLAFAGTAAAVTRWVNDNVATVPPPGTSCSSPGYNTIQAAVAAALPGDIIRVCAGNYTGPVVVDKTLTVRGARFGVDARFRAQTGESNVTGTTLGFDLRADNIVLDGFRVRNVTGGPGIYTSPEHSGYRILNNVVRDNVFGIYANSGSANQNIISRNLIRTNNRDGAAAQNGIYTDQGLENLVVRNNTFNGQLGTAINLVTGVGEVNDDVTIQSNFGLNNASFVLTAGNNTDLDILSNTTNDTVAERSWGGCQIRIDGDAQDIVISSNLIQRAPFAGICLREGQSSSLANAPDDIDVTFNRILGSDFFGIDSNDSFPGAALVNGNTVRDVVSVGIRFSDVTKGNHITNNSALRSGSTDCLDQSTGGGPNPNGTAGTANFWTNNVGATAIPRGICRRPS